MHIDKILETLEKNFKGKAISSVDSSTCAYLNEEGKKCAIGCFIPDGDGAQCYNGSVKLMLKDNTHLWEYMPFNCILKLQEFQSYHDNMLCESDPVKDQLSELKNIAVKLWDENAA